MTCLKQPFITPADFGVVVPPTIIGPLIISWLLICGVGSMVGLHEESAESSVEVHEGSTEL